MRLLRAVVAALGRAMHEVEALGRPQDRRAARRGHDLGAPDWRA